MPKFDRTRPLPQHTKLKYTECYAKCILEFLFPDRYTNLEIKDRPDLMDPIHNIGIEVVSADSQNRQEAISLGAKLIHLEEDSPQRQRYIERLNQIGYSYTSCGLEEPFEVLPPETTDIEKTSAGTFLEKCKDKIKKLNFGNYADFPHYDLFVDSQLYIEDWMIPKMLEKLMQINSDANKKFEVIHLKGFNRFFSFDMLKGRYYTVNFDQNLIKEFERLGWIAREMVEEGESV